MEKFLSPWGKFLSSERHHLAHHCADVAACFETLAALPVIRNRLEISLGRKLSPTCIARLAVTAFLHDIGKLNPGFQAKGWTENKEHIPLRGHGPEGAFAFSHLKMSQSLHSEKLQKWGVTSLFCAALAHHGRPINIRSSPPASLWNGVTENGYDPISAADEIGRLLPSWFPLAFLEDEPQPSSFTTDFEHFFCGLVSLADWLGSTRSIFPFVADLDPEYMNKARMQARKALTVIGLDTREWSAQVQGRSDFSVITEGQSPRPGQRLINSPSLDERLIILEAETGSGKTEAALWRFARLFEAGLIDSLYFALPTRAAAIQIHSRIHTMVQRFFGNNPPLTVLAVPGYLKAGDTQGHALPDWQVRWDDDDGQDEKMLLAHWAAEHAKRWLAATIAVGTVDQVMLSALQVKHAHLRSAALSRSLLVIDEVHASDRYMTEVLSCLLDTHINRGGYALLMSATLGTTARCKWLGTPPPSFAEAIEAPYPAVWGRQTQEPQGCDSSAKSKTVTMTLVPSWTATAAADRALAAAKQGARVLLIRNTVTAAIATYEEIIKFGGTAFLLHAGLDTAIPTLHHGRFAPEDRELLDRAVENALAPHNRPPMGIIVIGTQTLEQSLDIDADILITDLCPIDVLLQRIGRLHRHALNRLLAFETPQCMVLSPSAGLEKLLAPSFENGLGMFKDGGGVYRDLAILELTQRLVKEYPEWSIPEMNRLLVESATHTERIDALHAELGEAWSTYWDKVYGRDIANAGAARTVALRVDIPFQDTLFPNDEEQIRTRLGAEGARISFSSPVTSPFGNAIHGLVLPAYMSQGIDPSSPITPEIDAHKHEVAFSINKRRFLYNCKGITAIKS